MRRAQRSPREGAEDGAAATFRPVPGLRESPGFPTAHAMGYFLSLLRALVRSISRISTFLSPAHEVLVAALRAGADNCGVCLPGAGRGGAADGGEDAGLRSAR